MSNMTFKRQFENYRPNEYINAVRLTPETEFVIIDEPINDWSGVKIAAFSGRIMTGPIVDRLAAYERTYMEPEEIKEMQEEAKCMTDAIESLKKEVEVWKKEAEKWANRYTKVKDKFVEENNELKIKLMDSKGETQKWIDNRQGLRVEYDKVLHELTAVKDELAEARNAVKNREAEIIVLDDLVKSRDEELADHRRVNTELGKLFEDKSRENAVLKQNLNNVDGPRKYFEEKCALLEKEVKSKDEEIENLRSTIGCKDFTIKGLNEQIETNSHIYAEGWDKCAKIIEELEKENKELKAKQNGYAKRFLNCIYGSPFRGGSIYPKFPVDINDLIAKLREYKDIMVSVSQYDDSVTVNVTPWTPVAEEEEKKWSEVTEVIRELRKRLNDDTIHCFTAYCVSDDEATITISGKKKK